MVDRDSWYNNLARTSRKLRRRKQFHQPKFPDPSKIDFLNRAFSHFARVKSPSSKMNHLRQRCFSSLSKHLYQLPLPLSHGCAQFSTRFSNGTPLEEDPSIFLPSTPSTLVKRRSLLAERYDDDYSSPSPGWPSKTQEERQRQEPSESFLTLFLSLNSQWLILAT